MSDVTLCPCHRRFTACCSNKPLRRVGKSVSSPQICFSKAAAQTWPAFDQRRDKVQSIAIVRTRQSSAALIRAFWMAAATVAALAVLPAPSFGQSTPTSFADLAEQVSPSVVNITTTTIIEARADRSPMLPPGSPLEDMFKDFLDRDGAPPGQAERANALGSGFVISADGYIVTNNHVIEGADEIQIEFFSGVKLDAKLVGTDKVTDIALLKVEAAGDLPFVAFGDSDAMRVGDWVMAMGNPLGQGFSVSAGIVSARGRELAGQYDDFIQTDAAINRGNSGGPLFNMDGEVIGVNSAILSTDGGSIGIGFSMASNVVTKVVAQLRDFGETRRGWLGVRIQDIDPDMAEAMGVAANGALVNGVPDGPSKDAGVLEGDIIVSFNGVEVGSSDELVRTVADAEIGTAVPVDVLRKNDEGVYKTVTLSVKLGRREEAEGEIVNTSVPAPDGPTSSELLGLTVEALSPEMRSQFGVSDDVEGIIITNVDAASAAAEKGLVPGMVITEAGQNPVTSVADFEARVAEARDAGRKSLLVLVKIADNSQFLALPISE
jgi:serine protease Do